MTANSPLRPLDNDPTITHFSHWVELVHVAAANTGQRRAASLIMDVLLHQALPVIVALSVIRGVKLGGTLSCVALCRETAALLSSLSLPV